MSDKICFVVMGYGIKTDHRTGRQLDLDKTYEFLIKPVFDDLGITCIRSCDIPHSGVIDVPMYEHILKADIVVADISTLNANAIYELGIRHALRPYATIVIAEKELINPFDLNHTIITPYEHLGKDVGIAEATRFRKEFKAQVSAVLATPKTDSPVYTYLAGLTPPQFSKEEIKEIKKAVEQDNSLSDIIKEAEELKNNKKFAEAIDKLKTAQQVNHNPFITQRIALLTYKSKLPDAITALKTALDVLKPLQPDSTLDVETLGLCGAINKRLYEETGIRTYLEKAKGFYERGFLIARDYYNGINFSYLLLLSATLATDANNRVADNVNAARVRKKVKDICLQLVSQPQFSEMNDKVWILLTLAEVSFAEGNVTEEKEYLLSAKDEGAPAFAMDSYEEQKVKLGVLLDNITT